MRTYPTYIHTYMHTYIRTYIQSHKHTHTHILIWSVHMVNPSHRTSGCKPLKESYSRQFANNIRVNSQTTCVSLNSICISKRNV